MRQLSLALGLVVACAATGASAATVNLTGTYRCIQNCRDGLFGAPAFVTQNGTAVNLVTETGESYRAWPDWSAPYSRIWIEARNEGAVYSPDSMRIQFDDGRVWQRDLGPPVVVRRAPVVLGRQFTALASVSRSNPGPRVGFWIASSPSGLARTAMRQQRGACAILQIQFSNSRGHAFAFSRRSPPKPRIYMSLQETGRVEVPSPVFPDYLLAWIELQWRGVRLCSFVIKLVRRHVKVLSQLLGAERQVRLSPDAVEQI